MSSRASAVPQDAPEDLAGRELRDLVDDLDRAQPLVRCDALGHPGHHLVGHRRAAGHDERLGTLAGRLVGDAYDLSALRWVGCGAAPLDAVTEETCARRLDCLVGQGYGMSEATAAIAVVPTPEPERIVRGSVGELLPGTDARIVDPDTGADLGAGAEGELLVRGPQLMRGYRGRPEATAATIDTDGWLHTGDLATVEAEGVVRITDRLKELIKVKGFQVAPAELEGLLCTHPSVADAAVVGVPDEAAGERPKAFVVARGAAMPDEVMTWVAERVAPHKRLCAVEVVDEIPKLPSGKILRRVLRDR